MPFDIEAEDRRTAIKQKLRKYFDGKIVRKDLTKKIKEGANVPVYVLEFLLGQYCSSDDPEIIEQGVESVKKILADNFVRPDEAQKILSLLRQKGSHTVIDKITVSLNIKRDRYEAEFSNLGLSGVPIDEEYPTKFDRLLCPSLPVGGVDAAAEDVEHQRRDHIAGQSEQPLCHQSQKRHKERNREKNNFLQHRHHIKHFLSVRPYYKGIDYYVARMSSIICTPAVLQLREFL